MADQHQPDAPIRIKIKNTEFCILNSKVSAYGFEFSREFPIDEAKPLDYWKAQLAFRGYSTRGSNVDALKERLRYVNMTHCDPEIKEALANCARQAKKKRKASISQDDGQRAAPSRRRPSAAQVRPIDPVQQPQRPEPRRIVNRQFAGQNRQPSLQQCFFDETGRDKNAEPVEFYDLRNDERAHLHIEADDMNLFHGTARTARGNIMVIGSGKNDLGRQRIIELEGGRLDRYTYPGPAERARLERRHQIPDYGYNEEIVDEQEDANDYGYHDEEIAEEYEDVNGYDEGEPGEPENGPEDWDINGKWNIECPGMASCFGQYEPYTLEIFTSQVASGREIYGRFDFGEFAGIFRFCNTDPGRQHGSRYNVNNQFLLNREPSELNTTWHYRWRGKEMGEEVIQLGEDDAVYRMKFSEGGNVVRGSWGTKFSDPGKVHFAGQRIDDGEGEMMDIEREWRNHDQKAYDKANKDRWKRR